MDPSSIQTDSPETSRAASPSWWRRYLPRHLSRKSYPTEETPPDDQASPVKEVLITGWRGVSHSLALVNQHQILALSHRKDIRLHHTDMPWAMAHWNRNDHDSGFNQEETAFISALTEFPESQADCVYRIATPLHPPGDQARKTISFAVTELGYDQGNLKTPEQSLTAFTRDNNRIVTPSRWSRDRLIDFGFDEGGVRVVRHGVNLVTNQPATREELLAQRMALGIPIDSVIFLNVGVPTWNKGIDLLLRAFANIHRRHPNTHLILKDARALYGLPVDTVLQEVNREYPGLLNADVLRAIHVIPANLTQAALRQLYAFADWYVSPYRAEGFNLPVLEAQACGTPVIVTSGGATDDFCNTRAAWKIPGIFHRGPLREFRECCWIAPEYEALERLMHRAAAQGPRPPCPIDPLRTAARGNAEQHSWGQVADELYTLL